MLEIIQAKDFSPYYDLIKKLNIDDDIISVAEAVDKGNVIGFGIYHYKNDYVIINYLDSKGDLYLYDGIIRSILFLAFNNGINKAIFMLDDTSDIERLKFVENGEKCIDNIDKILSNCKSCKK